MCAMCSIDDGPYNVVKGFRGLYSRNSSPTLLVTSVLLVHSSLQVAL